MKGTVFWSMFFSALVAAGVSYCVSRYQFGFASPATAGETAVSDVPSLVGLQPEQARALLEPRGLLLVLDQEQQDARMDPGKISRQEPLVGSRLHRGESVRVVVARAPDNVPVPVLVGRSASKAKELLSDAGFVPGAVHYAQDDDHGDGIVLQQTPAAGAAIAKGSKVDLIVNHTPE